LIDRTIDRSYRKFDRERWRRRDRCIAQGSNRHADRAEIIGMMVGGMVLALVVISLRAADNQRNRTLGTASVRCMDVTEGEREVDGKREKRKPRAIPEMFPKPEHQVVIASCK
jgi:hypothetical protein